MLASVLVDPAPEGRRWRASADGFHAMVEGAGEARTSEVTCTFAAPAIEPPDAALALTDAEVAEVVRRVATPQRRARWPGQSHWWVETPRGGPLGACLGLVGMVLRGQARVFCRSERGPGWWRGQIGCVRAEEPASGHAWQHTVWSTMPAEPAALHTWWTRVPPPRGQADLDGAARVLGALYDHAADDADAEALRELFDEAAHLMEVPALWHLPPDGGQ